MQRTSPVETTAAGVALPPDAGRRGRSTHRSRNGQDCCHYRRGRPMLPEGRSPSPIAPPVSSCQTLRERSPASRNSLSRHAVDRVRGGGPAAIVAEGESRSLSPATGMVRGALLAVALSRHLL